MSLPNYKRYKRAHIQDHLCMQKIFYLKFIN